MIEIISMMPNLQIRNSFNQKLKNLCNLLCLNKENRIMKNKILNIPSMKKQQIFFEFILTLMVPMFIYFFAESMQFQELLLIDKLYISLIVFIICLMWFIHRRIQELQREIIQRKVVENAFYNSESCLHKIIEKNADGIIIVDGKGTIRFANPAAKKLFGLEIEKLNGELFGFPMTVGETTEVNLLHRNGLAIISEMRIVQLEWEGEKAYLTSFAIYHSFKNQNDSNKFIPIKKIPKEITCEI